MGNFAFLTQALPPFETPSALSQPPTKEGELKSRQSQTLQYHRWSASGGQFCQFPICIYFPTIACGFFFRPVFFFSFFLPAAKYLKASHSQWLGDV